MSDLYKEFLRDGGSLPGQSAGPRVFLGALGKHPGWDDHIDGLLDTNTLAQFKNIFYVQGIGRAVDSGVWDKPEMAGDLIDFDHYLMWVRGDQFMLGRLWSSSDGRGRTKYPMILCAQCSGVPLDWALQRVLPKLDQMRDACRAAVGAAEVRQIIQKAQAELQDLAGTLAGNAGGNSLLDRAAFLTGPELGPDQIGLMRILHELESNFSAYRKSKGGKTIGPDVRAQQVRVPRNASSPAASFLGWREFFSLLFPKDLPLLFVMPAGKPWLDIFAGEPSAKEIVALRVQSVGLASSVPYQIGPEIKTATAELSRQFESGISDQSGQSRIYRRGDNKQAVPQENWDKPPAAKATNLKLIGAIVGGIILVLLVCLLWPKHARPPLATPTTAPGRETVAVPAQPVAHHHPPPHLTPLKNESIQAGDTFAPLETTVRDDEIPVEQLTAKLQSSDSHWLPPTSLGLVRHGGNWTLRIDPAPRSVGASDVALIVTDSEGNSATNHFRVAVAESAASPPTLEREGPEEQVVRLGSPIASVPFRVSDKKTAVDRLTWSFDSSNPALLPADGIQVRHEGAVCRLTVARSPGRAGTVSVTVTVKNESGLAATSRVQFVFQEPKLPHIDQVDSLLRDARILQGETIRGVVKVSEADTPMAKLQLKAVVEPFPWVTASVSGAGAERTVELSAVNAAAGKGKLILELSDGETKITSEFSIEVIPRTAPAFVAAPTGVTEIVQGKTPPPVEFVISNGGEIAGPIHFSISSSDQNIIPDQGLTLSNDGPAWHLRIKPKDGAVGQTTLEAVITDAYGMATTNRFTVKVSPRPVAYVPPPRPVAATPVAPAPVVSPVVAPSVTPAAAATLPNPSTGPFRNSLGMEFIWVATLPGTLHGGWVAKYLVTQSDYSTVMQANPSVYKEGGPTFPVENITAEEMDDFCQKLTIRDQGARALPAGWTYHLLTLDQWQFCAANTPEAACILKRGHPEAVGSLDPNPLGLFDIIGNVYEVVLDANNTKVMTGANFHSPSAALAFKTQYTFSSPNKWAGFRIALIPAVQTR